MTCSLTGTSSVGSTGFLFTGKAGRSESSFLAEAEAETELLVEARPLDGDLAGLVLERALRVEPAEALDATEEERARRGVVRREPLGIASRGLEFEA